MQCSTRRLVSTLKEVDPVNLPYLPRARTQLKPRGRDTALTTVHALNIVF